MFDREITVSLSDGLSGWVQLCPPSSRHVVVVDPRDGAVLLLVQGPGARQRELWRWTAETFQLERTGIFPDHRWGEDLFGVLAVADSAAGEVLLCGKTAAGLVVTGRSADAAVRNMVLPDDRHGGRDLTGVFRVGVDLRVLADDGTVYADRDGALQRVGGPLPDEVRLMCAAADADRGVLVAAPEKGGCWSFAVGAGWAAGPELDGEVCDLAWNPWLRRVEMLRHGNKRNYNMMIERDLDFPPSTWLQAWDDEGDEPTSPLLDGNGREVRLVADQARGQWVAIGRHLKVLLAKPDGDFRSLPDPWLRRSLGWDALFFHAPQGPLRAQAIGAWQGLYRLESAGWLGAPGLDQVRLDRSTHVAAAHDGFFILDRDGALFFLRDDGDSERLAAPWGGLGGLQSPGSNHDGDQVRMVHDAPRDRLVLWIGSTRQTWVFHDARWTRLRAKTRPPAGTSRLCVTELGVYCLAGPQLWLLAGDRWAPVGADPDWVGLLLFSRPERPGLWSVSEQQIGVWHQGKFQMVSGLPHGVTPTGGPTWASATRYSVFSGVGYDPLGDRLMAFGPGGVWQLALDRSATPAAELPTATVVVQEDDIDEQPAAGSFSCLLLEQSVTPGSARQGDITADLDLDRLANVVEGSFNHVFDDDAGLAPDEQIGVLNEVLWGWTLHLWVVQRGVLTQGIDLRPYVAARYDDGTQIDLGPERHSLLQDLIDQQRYPIGYGVDQAGIAAAVPMLQPPLLESAGLLIVRFDGPRPNPDTFTYLKHGQRLHRGYQDLEGNVSRDELREHDNEIAALPNGLDELDELTEEELRGRGWQL